MMSELKNEIFGVKAQKSKHYCSLSNSAKKGNAVYMPKQGAALKRKKKSSKIYPTNLESLKVA